MVGFSAGRAPLFHVKHWVPFLAHGHCQIRILALYRRAGFFNVSAAHRAPLQGEKAGCHPDSSARNNPKCRPEGRRCGSLSPFQPAEKLPETAAYSTMLSDACQEHCPGTACAI